MDAVTPRQTVTLEITEEFQAALPAAPLARQESTLAPLARTPQRLVCKDLLVGSTRTGAEQEALELLPEMMSNTQVLFTYGQQALAEVNQLEDRIRREQPSIDIPELEDAVSDLSHRMRDMGHKYDPSLPEVREKYRQTKDGWLQRLRIAKTFAQVFMDDVTSLQAKLDRVIEIGGGKEFEMMRNLAYLDAAYRSNEHVIDKLIYVIGVMELVRDSALEQANAVNVGDENLGDREGERQARLLDFVTHLESKIIAYKSRLWVAWAMAPNIRNIRGVTLGVLGRINQTVGITIPTMLATITLWQRMAEAERAAQFNRAADQAHNDVLTMFANASKVTIPMIAEANATPTLDPSTVKAWSESFEAQADGLVMAFQNAREKQIELEQAILAGKQVMDAATGRVNEARLQQVLEHAIENTTIQVAKSVPAQTEAR